MDCATEDTLNIDTVTGDRNLITPLLLIKTLNDYCSLHSLAVFGRPFVKRFALYYRTVVCLSCFCLCVLSVFDVGVLWPSEWMDQDATW